MSAKVLTLFASGIRGHRDEPAPPAPAHTSEPLPILPDGSFDLRGTIHEPDDCAICGAFGQTCCKLHRELPPLKQHWRDDDGPIRLDRGGDDR
jgi:hypothetical protein